MTGDGKREYREIKRAIKKSGNKKLRNHLKEDLKKNPEEAHMDDGWEYGRNSSKDFNGMDEAEYRRRQRLDGNGGE